MDGMRLLAVLLIVLMQLPAMAQTPPKKKRLLAIGAVPTSMPSLEQVRHALFVPDQNMAVVFALLAAIVWLCWAAFTLSTLREVVAAIRTRGHGSARPLPRLEWVGRPAAQLVAAVVLLFVSAPGLISATAPSAAAAPAVACGAGADAAHRSSDAGPKAGGNEACACGFTRRLDMAHGPFVSARPGGCHPARWRR